MKRYKFNEKQKAEYNRLIKKYACENYYLKDAKMMARRDVENQIFVEERDVENQIELELARKS